MSGRLSPEDLELELTRFDFGTGADEAIANSSMCQAVQLCRIAEALEKLCDEGIYTFRVTQSEMDKKLKDQP